MPLTSATRSSSSRARAGSCIGSVAQPTKRSGEARWASAMASFTARAARAAAAPRAQWGIGTVSESAWAATPARSITRTRRAGAPDAAGGPHKNEGGGDREKPRPRQYLTAPQGVQTVPDVPNWAWHDYGMRVGFWRLFAALAKRKGRARPSKTPRVG